MYISNKYFDNFNKGMLLYLKKKYQKFKWHCLDVETTGMKTPNNIHNSTENPDSREGFDLLIILTCTLLVQYCFAICCS